MHLPPPCRQCETRLTIHSLHRFPPASTERKKKQKRKRKTDDGGLHPMLRDHHSQGYILKLLDRGPTGELDELIFESNVRGHQGRSSVNKQMRISLDTGGPPDFWQLNNGITITCSKIEGIDALTVQAHDPQVVNGLQTSRQIFGHFADLKAKSKTTGSNSEVSKETRSVLAKLI